MRKSLNWQILSEKYLSPEFLQSSDSFQQTQILGIGVDVSKDKLTIGLVKKTEADQELTWEIPNTSEAIHYFLQLISQSNYQKSIVLEPTNIFHLSLCNLAELANVSVIQVDPLKVNHFRKFLKGKTKTDKIDSLILAQVARHGFWQHQSNQLNQPTIPKQVATDTKQRLTTPRQDLQMPKQELRLLTNQLKTLQQNIQRLKSQLQHLRSLANSLDVIPIETIQPLEQAIIQLKEQQVNLEEEIEKRVAQIYEPETLLKLQEIPGISERLANLILAICDKTKTAKAWFSYAGVDPVKEESGTSLNKSKPISKRGNRYLRTLLFQMGFGAGVSKHGFFRDLYDELKQKGRHHVEATLIVGKKVLRIIHAVLTKGVRFDPLLAKTKTKIT
jgi:transposase